MGEIDAYLSKKFKIYVQIYKENKHAKFSFGAEFYVCMNLLEHQYFFHLFLFYHP